MATLNQADIKSAGGIALASELRARCILQPKEAFFAIGVLTAICISVFAHALGRGWERAQVQALRWRWFQTAAKIVLYGRQTFLKINSAMLAVFAAIRERCARASWPGFVQEGCVMPETS